MLNIIPGRSLFAHASASSRCLVTGVVTPITEPFSLPSLFKTYKLRLIAEQVQWVNNMKCDQHSHQFSHFLNSLASYYCFLRSHDIFGNFSHLCLKNKEEFPSQQHVFMRSSRAFPKI